MKIAILGPPLSGKTTLFRALAGGHFAEAGDAHLAAVPVPDARLDWIAEKEESRKVTYASVTFADAAGMRAGEDASARIDKLHSLLADADALLLVVQAYGTVDAEGRDLDPARDLQGLVADLLLTDMAIVDRRFERVEKEHKSKRKGEADPEHDFLERLREHLDGEAWARELEMSDVELNYARSYALLTLRPALVVFNVAEDDLEGQAAAGGMAAAAELDLPASVACAELEAELAEVPEEERAGFLAEYGLEAGARDRLIGEAYGLLSIVTFFTAGHNEARAWTIRAGTTAKGAAGKIHSDIEKGFVRAEVCTFEDYKAVGGDLDDVHRAGKVRLEGREYIVQDGDIINVRFTR